MLQNPNRNSLRALKVTRVQHYLKGPGAEGLLSRLTPANLQAMANHQSSLSCFLHPKTGGIVDDSIITRIGPQSFYFVTNAACRDKDTAFLSRSIDYWHETGRENVEWEMLDGHGLIALQGPFAASLLEALLIDLKEDRLEDILFGQSKLIKMRLQSGHETSPLLVSRGGYTGEDGFEISVPPAEVEPLVEFLLTISGPEKLRLAGLGARDSLRLEAGMCLYGHDLNDDTTPVEAALSWIIPKDRRAGGGFNGDALILQQLKPKKDGGSGVEQRRVGLVIDGAPAREGAQIIDAEGSDIGRITSGCPSPTLKTNIAMGYIKSGHHKSGTEAWVLVRGKKRKATVTKMPFVPSKYWKGGASPG